MSWNEPGGDKNKDPWSGRKEENGPPDLDEAIRSLQDKLGGLSAALSAAIYWSRRSFIFSNL